MVGGGLGCFGVGAGNDGGLGPSVAAVRQHGFAIMGEGEFVWVGLLEVGIGYVEGESEETHLPTDAGGSGSVCVPVFGDVCSVGEDQADMVGVYAGKVDVDPADVAGELPCKREV